MLNQNANGRGVYHGQSFNFGYKAYIPRVLLIMHSLVGKTPCSHCQNRKERVVLTRCRIGHSRLTHSYLLNNEERPECIPYNPNFSLKHVLIDCVAVADVRQTFYNANSLSNLFTNIAGDTILQFLKEIDLYTKI